MNKSSEQLLDKLRPLRAAAARLSATPQTTISECLRNLADLILARQLDLQAANQLDQERVNPEDPNNYKLLLNEDQLNSIAKELRRIADLPSPPGDHSEIGRDGATIRVIAAVVDARPDLLFVIFAHCLKAGRAVVFQGNRENLETQRAIHSVIDLALEAHGLAGSCQFAPPEKEALQTILTVNGLVDLVITPQGSQELIDEVVNKASVPVQAYGVDGSFLL